MKKLSRKVAALAVASLLVGTATGCGNLGNNTAPKDTGTKQAQEAEASASGGKVESEVGGTISFWINMSDAGPKDLNSLGETLYSEEIQKRTGITIDWQHPASGQTGEQFNMIIAGDKMPDIMYYNWLNNYPGGPDAAIQDGKILALNDLIEQYAPNFKHYMDTHPDVKKDITSDSGNIYCFPEIYTNTAEDSEEWEDMENREPFYETYTGAFVRKDWLDDLGLDIPETIDDWYNMLKAFKEEKGAKNPLSFTVERGTMGQLFASAFGVTVPRVGIDSTMGFELKDDGTVGYGPSEKGYKEYLTFMNKLYDEGLLDPDFMVQEASTVNSKILSDEVGATVYMTSIAKLKNDAKVENPDSTLLMVGVTNPVKEKGDTLKYFQATYPYRKSGAAITSSCENVVAAVKLLDYFWSEEGNMLLNWGIEGVSYQMVDGWPQFTQDYIDGIVSGRGDTQNEIFKYKMNNGPFVVDNWTRLVNKRDYTLKEGETDYALAALDAWNKNGTIPAGLPPTTLLPEESTAYSSKFNEISTYVDEMFAKFIMGQESLDNFDKYVDNLYGMGLQDVLDIQNAAVERYKNR